MKKMLFFIIVFAFFCCSVAEAALPTDLELNVVFDYFKLSADGSSWSTIVENPSTVNLLASTTQSTSGSTVVITPPPEGEYAYLGMGISDIYFSQTGQEDRSVLPILKLQNTGEDWDNMVLPILPFTYGGGDLQLNMYMPESNISGGTFDEYFPVEGPVFTFTGGLVSMTSAGTAAVVATGVETGDEVYAGAYQSATQTGPSFTQLLINAGDGSASGNMILPAGQPWYISAVAVEGMGVEGPQIGDKMYTVSGILPWDGAYSPIIIATGESANVALELAFTTTSTMGAGGSLGQPDGESSITFIVAASQSAITLESDAALMVYSYTSEAAMMSGEQMPTFLAGPTIAAGNFSSSSVTSSNLPAGTYILISLLDVNNNGSPDVGTDYFGVYGGEGVIEVVTLGAAEDADISGSPIYLNPYVE